MQKNDLLNLPTPPSINYLWNFGSLLGMSLVIQILTGFFLSMFYNSSIDLSFSSLIFIMNEISNGWMIRFFHSSGASIFFFCCYFHISKALFYGSFFFFKLWFSGLVIFFLLMISAFLGYILPWGQMSFWGATVITNLMSVVPYFGVILVEWVWGGFIVSEPTLKRFFSLHFIFPFIMLVVILIHLFILHETGSSNPLGSPLNYDKVEFANFFIIKDLITMMILMMILIFISLKMPFKLMDSENFMEANPLLTPLHIQPEWYFLFAYAILRSIPNKMGGVIMLILSIMIIVILPMFKNYELKSSRFMKKNLTLLFFHVGVFWVLTWLGANPVENPFNKLSEFYSLLYFSYYLL